MRLDSVWRVRHARSYNHSTKDRTKPELMTVKDLLRGLLYTAKVSSGRICVLVAGPTFVRMTGLVFTTGMEISGADINGNDGFHLSLLFNGL